jgi:hypothetical protein
MAKKDLKSTYPIRPHKVKKNRVSTKPGAKGTPCTMVIFKKPHKDIVSHGEDDKKLFHFEPNDSSGRGYKPPIDPLTGEFLEWIYDVEADEFTPPALDAKTASKTYIELQKMTHRAKLYGVKKQEAN